jgi:hypothetical protein
MNNEEYSCEVLADGCTPNAETILGRFPVEPINTLTSFGFLFIIIYWTFKTKFKITLYPVIVITMPLLACAFIGSTMHHALRNDRIWHTIDMLGIFYAVIVTCVYYWYRVTSSWLKSAFLVISIPIIFRIFLSSISLPVMISVSVVFVVLAVALLIPITIHCVRNDHKNINLLIIAVLTFIIALVFRQTDNFLIGIIPFGTHFLWHVFAMISVFYLLQYTFLTDKERNYQ